MLDFPEFDKICFLESTSYTNLHNVLSCGSSLRNTSNVYVYHTGKLVIVLVPTYTKNAHVI